MKPKKIIIFILSAIVLASCASLYAESKKAAKEKSLIEQHASELLLLSQEVLSAEKLYEKRSDLSEFGGECGQDYYIELYALSLKEENDKKAGQRAEEIQKIRANLNEIYMTLNEMFRLVVGGGTYFGHEYQRIPARTEYDIYRYLNDKKLQEAFKATVSWTEKDLIDFEEFFWLVAGRWRGDIDEGDTGYWFVEDGYKRVCDKMYEIKRGLIKLEETCTNRFYRERAEAYISSKMRALFGREEE